MTAKNPRKQLDIYSNITYTTFLILNALVPARNPFCAHNSGGCYMYAVVDIKGFQYKLEKGEKLKVPKYDLEVGKTVSIPEVMLVADDKDVKIGAPYVEGAVVEVTVTDQGKYPKVTVFKKKRRKDYSVKRGHRQDFTEIEVKSIKVGKKKAAAKKAADAEAPAAEAKE